MVVQEQFVTEKLIIEYFLGVRRSQGSQVLRRINKSGVETMFLQPFPELRDVPAIRVRAADQALI